jgi:hypothetical protein
MPTRHRYTFTIPSPLQFDQPVQFSQKTVKLNDGFFVQPTAKPNDSFRSFSQSITFSLQFDQPVQFSQKTVKLNDGFFVQPTAQPNGVGPLARGQKNKKRTPLTAF